MAKLNQIIAVEKGLKSRVDTALTKIYHTLQKADLFGGVSRTYTPLNDEGEQLSPEGHRVRLSVEDQLKDAAQHLIELFDVTATKETGNLSAMADVEVDGTVIVRDAPVTYLLFLEKQLVHLRTVVGKLPILDDADEWSFDAAVGLHKTPPVLTRRTNKVPKVLVKAAATDRHPAQTEVFTVDETVGHWETVKSSGAVTLKRREELLARVNKLLDAVKTAREEANSIEVTQIKPGKAVFDYLLA